MNFCVRPLRRIASNLLWTPGGLLHDPLLEIAADGRVSHVASCSAPDRRPFTEFYAGLLVPDFPAAYRGTFDVLLRAGRPLTEMLPAFVPAPQGCLVVISGLDYAAMRLTVRSRILKIG